MFQQQNLGQDLCLRCLCTRLIICALWSPAGKRLNSWLSFVRLTVVLFVDSLFNVAPIVYRGSVFGSCFVNQYFVSS